MGSLKIFLPKGRDGGREQKAISTIGHIGAFVLLTEYGGLCVTLDITEVENKNEKRERRFGCSIFQLLLLLSVKKLYQIHLKVCFLLHVFQIQEP